MPKTRLEPTSATLVGVWSPGPALSSRARSFTEPVNGTRNILDTFRRQIVTRVAEITHIWSSASDSKY